MLAEPEADREQAEQQPEQGAHQQRRQDAQPQLAGEIGDREAGHGAQEHDALDAQIEHAGALAEQLAQRRQQQGGGHPEHGREEADLEQQVPERANGPPPRHAAASARGGW